MVGMLVFLNKVILVHFEMTLMCFQPYRQKKEISQIKMNYPIRMYAKL